MDMESPKGTPAQRPVVAEKHAYSLSDRVEALGNIAWLARRAIWFEQEVCYGPNGDRRSLTERTADVAYRLEKVLEGMAREADALAEAISELPEPRIKAAETAAFLHGGKAGIMYVMARIFDRDQTLYDEIEKQIPGFTTFEIGNEMQQLGRTLRDMYGAARRAA